MLVCIIMETISLGEKYLLPSNMDNFGEYLVTSSIYAFLMFVLFISAICH